MNLVNNQAGWAHWTSVVWASDKTGYLQLCDCFNQGNLNVFSQLQHNLKQKSPSLFVLSPIMYVQAVQLLAVGTDSFDLLLEGNAYFFYCTHNPNTLNIVAK